MGKLKSFFGQQVALQYLWHGLAGCTYLRSIFWILFTHYFSESLRLTPMPILDFYFHLTSLFPLINEAPSSIN